MKMKVRYRIVHVSAGPRSTRTVPRLTVTPDEKGTVAEVRLCYCCGKIIKCSPPKGRLARELQVRGSTPEFDFDEDYAVVGSPERICRECENVLKKGRNSFAIPVAYQLRGDKYYMTRYGQKPGPSTLSDPLVVNFKKLAKFWSKENTDE